MLASADVHRTVETIIRDTYARLSTPGSEFSDLFCDPDLTVVGSGVGELFAGPETASHGVSIRAAEQEGIGADARLVFITHEAVERDVQATVRRLRDLPVVRRVGGLIRVIGS